MILIGILLVALVSTIGWFAGWYSGLEAGFQEAVTEAFEARGCPQCGEPLIVSCPAGCGKVTDGG